MLNRESLIRNFTVLKESLRRVLKVIEFGSGFFLHFTQITFSRGYNL